MGVGTITGISRVGHTWISVGPVVLNGVGERIRVKSLKGVTNPIIRHL